MARVVRWVGHPAPLDSPSLVRFLLSGRAPRDFVEAVSRFEKNYRLTAIPGRSTYTIGILDGMSQTYQWGPQVFEQLVEEADWRLLIAHPLDRAMFQDVSDNPSRPETLLTNREWEALMVAFVRTPPPRVLLARSG